VSGWASAPLSRRFAGETVVQRRLSVATLVASALIVFVLTLVATVEAAIAAILVMVNSFPEKGEVTVTLLKATR